MSLVSDRGDCLRNVIRVMCCDGKIAEAERQFLAKVAHELNAKVRDWPTFIKEVLRDPEPVRPIADPQRALATLEAMVRMARADGAIHRREKRCLAAFAKAIGVSAEQWRRIVQGSREPEGAGATLREAFSAEACTSGVYALTDDFEQVGALLDLAAAHDVPVETRTVAAFLADPPRAAQAVCFHAAEETETTLERCRRLLEVAGEKTAAVLTRFQGRQVQYMLEAGLKRCVIEPLYAEDLPRILGAEE